MLTKPTPEPNRVLTQSPEALIVSGIRANVLPSLAAWADEQFEAGATVEAVQKHLYAAIGQINRVSHYCTVREELSHV